MALCEEEMIHVIFVIRRVFICVELSNTIWLIFLLNNWFCRIIFTSNSKGSDVDYSGIC